MVYEQMDLASDLPENTRYQDEGCSLSNSCLNCPFPRCIHDLRGGETRLFKKSRNKEIILLAKKGIKTKDLAKRFGLTQRSIELILRNAKLRS